MSGNNTRLAALATINNYEPTIATFDFKKSPSGDLFATNVFTLEVMQKMLPKNIFRSVKETIEEGKPLDVSVADAVASAMKEWAMGKGATHYAHIFYPLTDRTAEKHDSFFEPDGSGHLAEFSGKLLIRQEPDGSSFPNAGLRATHEARAYTVWDVTSPAYIIENPNGTTLCIPTAFVSWKGEALDKKTPLLRSMKVLNEQAQRMLQLFGHEEITMVSATAGAEQEYFLIDNNFVLARPDLLSAGRTLVGAKPPKGQEFDDHYFGAIPERVQTFMLEFERELFKLGIPVKTRHNEVAPGQYEVAPVFETANIASDHQQLVMTLISKVAGKHGFTCVTHEKPFAGVNGSGKHLNFSLSNSTQGNLLEPGDNPHDNVQFLVFCTAVLRSVYKYAKLLRASVASASNDHRLGANEAPPAIISVFLGEQLTDVFKQIKAGKATSSLDSGTLHLGVDTLPILDRHSGDRNRTSPFAFTGNKFEFRAVGSHQSIAWPTTILNTILADSLDFMATRLEQEKGDFYENVEKLLTEIINEIYPIVFNGDGYAETWQTEAKKRGLPNLKTAADALPELGTPEAIELFGKFNILSEIELLSRRDVRLEQYINSILVEAKTLIEMGRTLIFPAAIRYQNQLAMTCANLKTVGYVFDTDTLDKITALVKALQDSLNTLEKMLTHESDDLQTEATYLAQNVIPQMLVVREAADELEGYVADDLWPLPTYQEMLFIR